MITLQDSTLYPFLSLYNIMYHQRFLMSPWPLGFWRPAQPPTSIGLIVGVRCNWSYTGDNFPTLATHLLLFDSSNYFQILISLRKKFPFAETRHSRSAQITVKAFDSCRSDQIPFSRLNNHNLGPSLNDKDQHRAQSSRPRLTHPNPP